MVQATRGIVLRSVKYGETSLVCTVFTEVYGTQSYMVQGVRSAKAKNKAALFQPATLLDMIVYNKPGANLQRIKEYQPAYIYQNLQEHVVKNAVALFSVELLLRLLPEQAPFSELYDFSFEYFKALDAAEVKKTGNFPLFFLVQCSAMLGYNISGAYGSDTPHLNLQEGGFSAHPPVVPPHMSDADSGKLYEVITATDMDDVNNIALDSGTRFRLMDWLLAFLHTHTQHLGTIKSLQVLRTILH